MTILSKLWAERKWLRSLPQTIWFNFRFLPFKQAIKLPIWLYKPHFLQAKGEIVIESTRIRPGMIKLGGYFVSLYPNSGITFDLHKGSRMVFKGACLIGNNSTLSVGSRGTLSFGDDFLASTTLRMVCYKEVTLGRKNRCGWDVTFMDTDLHAMTKTGGGHTKGYGYIRTGAYNWFGTKCHVMKFTETPNYCTFSACTKVSGKVDVPEYSVVGQSGHLEVKRTGVWRNPDDDKIDFDS